MLVFIFSQIFYEDFESTTFPPSNWQNTGTRNTKWVRRTSGVVFGNASAGTVIAQTSSEEGTSILQTPAINLPSISPYDNIIFSFYYRLPSVGGQFDTRFRSTDTIKVQISTDGNNWNDLVVWDSTTLYTGADNQRKKVQFNISSYQNSSIYIRWMFIDNTSATVSQNSYFNIDSVFISVQVTNLVENKENVKLYISKSKLTAEGKGKLSISSIDGRTIISDNLDSKKTYYLRKGIYLVKFNNMKKVILVP